MISFSTDPKDIRKFGGIALVLFGCLCALAVWKQKIIPGCLFGFLALLGFGFIILPVRLQVLYVGWLKIAGFIGLIINTVALTIAYYLVITPAAIIIRLFRGPFLPMGPDRKLPSYWVERAEPVQPKERFSKRF